MMVDAPAQQSQVLADDDLAHISAALNFDGVAAGGRVDAGLNRGRGNEPRQIRRHSAAVRDEDIAGLQSHQAGPVDVDAVDNVVLDAVVLRQVGGIGRIAPPAMKPLKLAPVASMAKGVALNTNPDVVENDVSPRFRPPGAVTAYSKPSPAPLNWTPDMETPVTLSRMAKSIGLPATLTFVSTTVDG